MSRFVFRLQAVLDCRQREMTRTQLEVERCQGEVRANLREQDAVRTRQKSLEIEFLAFSKNRNGPCEYLQFLTYRQHLEEELDRLARVQTILEGCLRHAQEVAQEASRSHRRVEISKERALESWKAEQQQKEIEMIDEWGSLHGGRAKR